MKGNHADEGMEIALPRRSPLKPSRTQHHLLALSTTYTHTYTHMLFRCTQACARVCECRCGGRVKRSFTLKNSCENSGGQLTTIRQQKRFHSNSGRGRERACEKERERAATLMCTFRFVRFTAIFLKLE